MARIRTIKPEFPHSESMGRISRDARLCFIMLWTIADDSGRLRGNSRMLASLLYPYDSDAGKLIDKWLSELEEEKCIDRYIVDRQSYIQIHNWLCHQKIDKPSQSKIPAFANPLEYSANPLESSSEEWNGMDLRNGMDHSDSGESPKKQSFKKPTIEEVDAYCRERGNQVNAQKWIDHYESKGWKIGKNPMKDWKAAVRTWEPDGFKPKTLDTTPKPIKDEKCPRCGANRMGQELCDRCANDDWWSFIEQKYISRND
jgi:hypothetical protein